MKGIYKIENKITHSIYIGSSINIKNRMNRHFKDLKNKKHHSIYLQRSFDKYGKDSFEFSIIEEVYLNEDLLKREQYWMDKLLPEYNNAKKAGNCFGVKHSKEIKLNNSIRNSGFNNGNCKITELMLSEILLLINDYSISYISKKYNVHRSSLTRLFKKLNIVKKKIYSKESRLKLSISGQKNLPDKSIKVGKYDANMNKVCEYKSIAEASRINNIKMSSIYYSCKNPNSKPIKPNYYYFRYLNPKN